MNNLQYYDLNDSTLFKGIGILMIVFHNYLHWQPGFGIENEASFNVNNIKLFIDSLYPLKEETFSAIAGFLGHYGIQIFIFFSAYGLSIQRLKSNGPFNYQKYLSRRLKKLYFLLFYGILVFLVLYLLIHGNIPPIKRLIYHTFYLSTSISNFNSSSLYEMFSGPFWFFGLMVQLYILFPLIYYTVKKINIYLIFIITFGIIYLLYLFVQDIHFSLFFGSYYGHFSLFGTIFGHLPEVILGIYFAQHAIKKPSFYLFLGSIILFILSQIYWFLFPFSFACIIIILLYLINAARVTPYTNKTIKNILLYVGTISMILYVVNGPLRNLSIFQKVDPSIRGERIFLFLILLFIISSFLYILYNYLRNKLRI